MADKPVHRRRAIISDDRDTHGPLWLIPSLLVIEAFFVGSTFDTLSATLPAMISAGLLVSMMLQWSSGSLRAALSGQPGAERPAESAGVQRGEQDHAGQVQRSQRKSRGLLLSRLRAVSLLPVSVVIAGSGAAFRLSHHLRGNLNPMAMLVDMVAHFSFLFSLMLWVYYPRRGHPAMLWFGLLLALMSVTAGGVSHTINGQLVAALTTIIGFSFASDHILSRWQPARAAKRRAKRAERGRFAGDAVSTEPLPRASVSIDSERSRSGLVYSILALSLLLMATSAAGHLTAAVVPSLQTEFFDRLSKSLEAVTSNSIIGSSRYVRGSRLGSIRQHMTGDPSEVALRAFAVNAPGYLRGTAFDFYRHGGWSTVNERSYDGRLDRAPIMPRQLSITGIAETALVGDSTTPLQRFSVRKNPGGDLLGTVEMHNVPLKGQIVFTSLSTDWIEAAVSFRATATHHDVVVKGIDTQNPYVLSINKETPREKLERIRRDILLQVPPELKRHLDPVAAEVCGGRLTAQSKARALEDFFEENFSYSLRDTTVPAKLDPVVHFLQSKHPGHCEYFATAAAMLLRSAGVPARYVTGYVVSERSEDDAYWLARNRDAHAWVEAYDDISERWFPVEATVGRTYHSLLSAEEIAEQTDVGDSGFLDLEDERTVLGRFFGWLFSFRTSDSLTWIFRIAQLPLFCMLVVLLWVRHRQKMRANEDVNEVQSRQMLQRVDRRMKRFALVRAPNETLHQFARRVDAAAKQSTELGPLLRRAADWYRSFAEARYRGRMPEPLAEA